MGKRWWRQGADFVPPNDRIATFDNDGALWAEHGTRADGHRAVVHTVSPCESQR
jgi:hypothetical protein